MIVRVLRPLCFFFGFFFFFLPVSFSLLWAFNACSKFRVPAVPDVSQPCLTMAAAAGQCACVHGTQSHHDHIVAGACVRFQVKSRRMFALCENHELVKTLKEYRKLGFLQSLVYPSFSIFEPISLSLSFSLSLSLSLSLSRSHSESRAVFPLGYWQHTSSPLSRFPCGAFLSVQWVSFFFSQNFEQLLRKNLW